METFTAWLRQQMRQRRLNCRRLAGRTGLTATQIRLAVAQDVTPSALAVRRLAVFFDADEDETLRLAGAQVAAAEKEAQTDQERRLVCLLYGMSATARRAFTHRLEARLRAHAAQAQEVAS